MSESFESPIFAIQESYYRAKFSAILDRTFNELGHNFVEMFDTQAHAELTLEGLRKLKAFSEAFSTRIKVESAGLVFLIIAPFRSRIHERDLNQVIARIANLARSGISVTAEIYADTKDLQRTRRVGISLSSLR